MCPGLGTAARAAFRIEGSSESGTGIDSSLYPREPDTNTPHADEEEVKLDSSDLIPLLSEGVDEAHEFANDETLIGTPAITNHDRVGIGGSGAVEVRGMYDGLDALIACALGFEAGRATEFPDSANPTALSSGAMAAGTWVDAATPFSSGDVGKFIRTTAGVEEGQVRRISAYNSTSSVDITPNWDATPAGAEAAEMDQEFIHLFECAKQLHTELHSLEDASYPTGGVGTTSDKIIRRGTFGIEKGGSKPWIFRSCMINSMTISVVAGEAMKLTFEMIPFDLDRDSATNTASTGWDWTHDSPLFQDNEVILFADASYFRIDSLANAPLAAADNKSISEFELTINNNLKVDDQDTLATPYRIEPVRSGMREITGRIKVPRYEDDTYVDWMDADTELIANIKFAGSTIATVARYFEIWLPSIKITSRSLPVGGADALSQDFNFRCFAPAAAVTGFPTVYQTAPYSEAIIRILNQNPFNLFRDQNKGY